jgi:hypothetical protein
MCCYNYAYYGNLNQDRQKFTDLNSTISYDTSSAIIYGTQENISSSGFTITTDRTCSNSWEYKIYPTKTVDSFGRVVYPYNDGVIPLSPGGDEVIPLTPGDPYLNPRNTFTKDFVKEFDDLLRQIDDANRIDELQREFSFEKKLSTAEETIAEQAKKIDYLVSELEEIKKLLPKPKKKCLKCL